MPDLSADRDWAYGSGFYRAHVLGTDLYTRALLNGSAGATAVVETFNEHHRCGSEKGIVHDSHDNVCKVTVYAICNW